MAVSSDVYEIIKREHQTVIMVTHNLEEAITMSNKVYILSKRPCTIKKIFDINLEGNSPILKRCDSNFNSIYESIWKELDINV